jgi:hypothetical protein
MKPWRVCTPVAADSYHFDEEQDSDPDPHYSEKLDSDQPFMKHIRYQCVHLENYFPRTEGRVGYCF